MFAYIEFNIIIIRVTRDAVDGVLLISDKGVMKMYIPFEQLISFSLFVVTLTALIDSIKR